jgi:transcriptional regulator with XRE-family HTH domain
MTIGQRIRKIRRERGITQEQLAEYLNLSASAVSQWECDRVMPDITQLPLLANLFEVSADVLLGIDVDSKAKKIDEIYHTALKTSQEGRRYEAIGILRDGLRQYPDSFRLMEFLVAELRACPPKDGEGEEELAAYRRQMEMYLDRILAGCTDDAIRASAVQTACFLYPEIGRYDDAVKLAESIPEGFTRQEMLCILYSGTKRYETKRDDILSKFTNSIGELTDLAESRHDDGTDVFTDDEKLRIYEKQIAMFALYFDDGRYLYHAQYPKIAHLACAEIHAGRQNADKTLYHLEQAAKFAVEFVTMKEDDTLTSLLARGIPDGGAWQEEHNQAGWMLETCAESRYNFVRGDERFKHLVEKLKLYAR